MCAHGTMTLAQLLSVMQARVDGMRMCDCLQQIAELTKCGSRYAPYVLLSIACCLLLCTPWMSVSAAQALLQSCQQEQQQQQQQQRRRQCPTAQVTRCWLFVPMAVCVDATALLCTCQRPCYKLIQCVGCITHNPVVGCLSPRQLSLARRAPAAMLALSAVGPACNWDALLPCLQRPTSCCSSCRYASHIHTSRDTVPVLSAVDAASMFGSCTQSLERLRVDYRGGWISELDSIRLGSM
jgi:heme exporter protein D